MKLRLKTLGPATAFLCEMVGLASLALAPDVDRTLFLVPVSLGVGAWALRAKLPNRLLLLLITLLVLAGYATAGIQPTGGLVARALIPAHAMLWLAADERAYRFWRLGVALIELVLAAILAPEAYMFALIFLFVIMSSLALSLGFIERRFQARDPDALTRPLRGSYVASVLALSCLIFLSSLLIFPLLPRARWNGNDTAAGYTDVVTFQQGILRWGQQSSKPALWLFRSDGRAWESIVPFLLLRGQALERFDGHDWRATPGASPEPAAALKPEGAVEVLRQPLPTDVLPVPYGAMEVQGPSAFPVGPLGPGEWSAMGARGQSVRYEVRYGAFRTAEYGRGPTKANTAFPKAMFPGIERLAEELGRGARRPEDKVAAVLGYYRKQGFTAELRPMGAYHPGQAHPLENFLFRDRAGHCELFASSAALLLRAMGLPARLVVGFRVRPPRRGDVLTVRASDAHAWAEFWTESRGWRPVDPTPVTAEPGWASETFGEAVDLLGAYWTRYILEYEFDLDTIFRHASSFLGSGSVLVLLAGLGLWWRRRRGPASARAELTEVLLRFEDDLVHRAGVFPAHAYRDSREAQEWRRKYTVLRFGRQGPDRTDVARMRRQAAHLVSRAKDAPSRGSDG